MSPRRSPSRRRHCWRRSCTRTLAASARCASSCDDSTFLFAMPPELRAAVVQDAENGDVLMLAWMNDEALQLTRETGEAHFFSRSRQRLWRKGETSGNVLAVEELREDCD